MKAKTIRNLIIVFVLITALWMSPGFNNLAASASPVSDVVFDETTIISDDFNPCRMKPGVWTKNEQDGDIEENGTQVRFVVPSTLEGHAIYGSSPVDFENNSVNITQVIPDGDFEIEVKFDSIPLGIYATQGIFIQEDENDLIRIEFYSNRDTSGQPIKFYVGQYIDGEEETTPYNETIFTPTLGSLYIRVERTGDEFTIYYYQDSEEEYYTVRTYDLTVSAIGIYGGNEPPDGVTEAPAYTAVVDYFFNNDLPISPINGATLEVDTAVTGNGTVDVDPTSGYNCEDLVEIDATADPGWTFSGWSGYWGGDYSSTEASISGNIYESIDLTGTFTQDEYTFATNVSPEGAGSVAKDPDQSTYHYDDEVDLTATAAAGYSFDSWSGDASGTLTTTSVTVQANTSVTANFTQDEYTITKNIVPALGGDFTIDTEQSAYHYGDIVTVTAVPSTGYAFTSWGDAASGTNLQTQVTITGNTTITANFAMAEYTIDTISAHGTVTLTPNQSTYHYGDEVTVEITPDSGWIFSHWSGDIDSTEKSYTFTVDGNMQIVANFTQFYIYLPLITR